MIRLLMLAGSLFVSAAMLSCQTYSTGLQQSMGRANETLAVTALKTASTAQQAYAVANGGSYGTFQQLCEGGYLDGRFNSSQPQFKDYVLSMETGANFYSINADPSREGEQQGRHLYLDATSPLIHVNATQPATAGDPPIQP